jgi:hypothetical protein
MPNMSHATRMKVVEEAYGEIDSINEEIASMQMLMKTIQNDLAERKHKKAVMVSVIFRTSNGLEIPENLIEDVRQLWRKIRRVEPKLSRAKVKEESTSPQTIQ